MNVKFIMDDFSSFGKDDVVREVVRELGSHATVSGNVITVDDWYARRVTDILDRHHVNYSKKSAW